ncbi:hypothetical protein C0V77_13675 [Emticicia sp. TH156]|nr:hypothetical protein C0V77_13675 [Emticicia sp. TH156]
MMQTYFLKFQKKLFIIFIFSLQFVDSQAQKKLYTTADSLFKQKKFDEAASLYEKIITETPNFNPKVYLKLANIYENRGDFVMELYYLNLYSFRYADERVFEKIYTIATENGYKGYEKNDLNYFLYYFRQYSIYVWAGFLIIGIYVFAVFLIKRLNNQYSPIPHKILFLVYLVFLSVLINLPNNYRTAIIKNEQVYLRDYPSAASHIVGIISEGHRLNVINSEDIWYQVLWDGKFCYIKQSDILLIH